MVGYVADPFATILDGVPAIALESEQVGLPVHGFSGAPVMINVDPFGTAEGDRDAVVGLIRWAPTDPDQPDAALAGLVYASPSSATWKWNTVRPSFFEPTKLPLPHETAIRNFVHQYLGDPGRPTPFGGRTQDISRIEAWLDDPAAPHFMLVATRAGLGKSALLVRLCDRLETLQSGIRPVFVPITIRWELNGRTAVFEALAARLAAARGETIQGGIDSVESAASKLRQASTEGQRLVAVLDGLDEADGWDASPSLLPLDLGRGVRVIVAARLTADRPRPEDWLAALGWTAGNAEVLTLDPLTQSGVAEAITSMGPALVSLAQSDRVATLYRISGGDPLVLSLYLSDLLDKGPELSAEAFDDLEQRKPGIASYMSAWWRDQEKLWGGPLGQQATVVRLVLNVLSCALGPLPRRDLLRWVNKPLGDGDTDTLDHALRALRRFVIVDPKTQGYAVSHPQLADFRRAQLDADVSRYDQQFIDWGRETITALSQQTLKPVDTPPYLVRHYSAHLERANASATDFLMLVSQYWRDAWEAVTDEFEGAIRDVSRAQRRLANENRLSTDAGRLPQQIDGYVGCAIWRAAVLSRAELVTPEFAAELVHHGLWPASRALALVRQLPNLDNRGFALGALTPKLPRAALAVVEGMLGELQITDPLAFGAGFAGLIDAYCRQDRIDRARRLVDELAPGYAHGLGCVRLIGALQGSLSKAMLLRVPDDLANSGSLEQGLLLDRLTATVARQMANETFAQESAESGDAAATFILPYIIDSGSADQASNSGDWADIDPAWLSGLLPWLSAQTREAALERVVSRLEESGNLFEINSALTELGQHLDAPLAERAVEITQAHISHEHWQVEIFAALLNRLPEPRRSEIRQWIVDHLSIGLEKAGHYERQALVSRLVEDGLQEDLLSAIDSFGSDSWSKDKSMEALGPYLRADQIERAFAVAMRARHEIREGTLAPVLTRLASLSSDSAKRALGLVTTLSQDADELSAARAVLGAVMGRDERIQPALEVSDDDLRYAALAGASVFAAISGDDLHRAVRSFGPDENRLSASCFEVLVERLPDAEMESKGSLAAVEEVIRKGIHERKDQIMIRYFSRVASLTTTEHVLALGRRLSPPRFNYPLVWALAGACLGGSNPDTAEIRRTIQRIKPGFLRNLAQASEIRCLPQLDQQARWLALLNRIDADEAKRLPGRIAVLVELLPSELRRPTVDYLFSDGYLSGREIPWALKEMPSWALKQWASSVQELVPVLERDHLELVLAASKEVESASYRSSLRATAAAQLARLATLGEAFQVLDSLDGRYALTGLERMIDVVPDSALPDLVWHVHVAAKLPIYRSERVRVWAKAVGRLRRLPLSTHWMMIEQWLNEPITVRELLVDLLGYFPALIALGGPQVAGAVLDRLADQV